MSDFLLYNVGIMVQSIFWNRDYNILAGVQETTLTVWYHPGIVFTDRRLLRRSTLIKDTRFVVNRIKYFFLIYLLNIHSFV